jgi:hypothetical protein
VRASPLELLPLHHARAARVLAATLSAAAFGFAACDLGDAVRVPVRGPAPTATVFGSTELTPAGEPVRTQLGALAAGPGTVLLSASFVVQLDRFALPTSAVRQAVCLRPDLTPPTTLSDCSGAVFLEPAYDPVRRTLTLRQPAGARLSPDTEYRLTLFAATSDAPCASDAAGCGLRAFDGAPLAAPVSVDFRTVAADPAGATDDLAPTDSVEAFCARAWCQACCDSSADPNACKQTCPAGALTTLASNCGGPVCHGSSFSPEGAMGLALHGPAVIRETAVGVVAHQTQTGEVATSPESSPSRFGRSMAIVDPGAPAGSYLLYKALAHDQQALGASPDEVQRLRNGLLSGDSMPPSEGYAPLAPDALDNLSRWIATGAYAEACPPPPSCP